MAVKDQGLYLNHIMECIDRIEQYASSGYEDFLDNTMIQDAIYRNLEIIGEAARHLHPETRSKMTNIPWKKVIGLRNVLIHAYDGVDPSEVWLVIEKELPKLKEEIRGYWEG